MAQDTKIPVKPVTFGNQPGRLRLLGLFWLAELIIAVVFFFIGLAMAGQDAVFGLVMTAMSVFLFATSLAFLSDVRFRLSEPRPTIEVSAQGFLDRRLSDEPMPWDAIAGIPYYWYRQRSLALIPKDGADARLRPIFALRFQEWLGRMLSMPGYPIIVGGNEAEVETLEKAIRAHAPHLVRAG